ncbi:MAG: glycoside hydrolase family 15 protein [Burkholderiaceae bacterium]
MTAIADQNVAASAADEPNSNKPPDFEDEPIEDHALIGDCHGAALVARDGTIDWATISRFDADPVFCRLLDHDRGGHWSIRPRGDFTCQRAYLPDTNMLRTVFETSRGSVALLDFMPVGRKLDADVHDYVRLNAPGWIVRRVECLRGVVEMELRYRPSKAFAREVVDLQVTHDGVSAGDALPRLYGAVAFRAAADVAEADFELVAGQQLDFVLADSVVEGQSPQSRVPEFLAATKAFWQEWIGYCRYRGPHEAVVRRSALALKLLTYAPTGAIVAAPTTSLPESIGGARNWDYRFCWVRDASFALYALSVLGYSGEARCFHQFLQRACVRSLPRVRPMYGIDAQLDLPESTVEGLSGWRNSAPVRVGNGAYQQNQIDVYGQMLDLAWMYQALGGRLDAQYRRLLDAVAAYVAAHWREPDQGIWEIRGPARHHVHGKLMCWVALERAGRLLDPKWLVDAERVRADILAHVAESGNGWLRQAFDGGVDAAVLLAPMLGFALPDGVLTRTIDEVVAALGRGDVFLARYWGDDGLEGAEGEFLVCSCWLADAELANGRLEQARTRIDRLVGCANDVGLFAEEVDAKTGAFLGNFPQALTHLGLIGCIVNLQLADRAGAAALAGGYAERAARAVGATFGWRGVVAAIAQSRQVGRFRSSTKSCLAWP